ncbi:MAG: SPFH domain-containing protein [Cyanobacteria bacterium]|nr:SPFH domain-containing protein [Cyanobacteriota bacterium]
MTTEKLHWNLSGPAAWVGLLLLIAIILGCAISLGALLLSFGENWNQDYKSLILPVVVLFASLFLTRGFVVIQPNDALVLVFVGSYSGTVKRNGLVLVNPFCSRTRISQRLQNLQGPVLKVNDKRGNPIEIAAVIVWHVAQPSRAIFDVDNYELFVRIQSEAAVRHIANLFAYDSYDHTDSGELTLRSSVNEVSHSLKSELDERLAQAGLAVDEARISHLAYAPEIAMAMLKRQQAEAIVSARRAIVSGAVSIVTSTLQDLAESKLINLNEERKASMVSNLLVVLCSDSQAQPIINAGSGFSGA